MAYSLVIVESPAKAKTIAGYLGDGYRVESSIGHVRDLPMRAADVPAAYRDRKWAKLGIDVENDFEPLYVVSPDKKEQISRLRSVLKEADRLFLATDEDREGEAIAWHLQQVLKPKVPVHRMVFHEITRKAITEALGHTRDIDEGLVDAQETRRVLDRLYGYELSPVLWKMISKGLSAGRVQSVATRIVVERERERMAFIPADYWDLEARLSTALPQEFSSSLAEVDGLRVASGRDFDDDGSVGRDGVVVLDEDAAMALAAGLAGGSLAVDSVEARPYRRRPAAPFMTSTFQQEAGRRLKMSASMAMHAAQGLYQKGYITYMRTDSTSLSETAVRAARNEVQRLFGPGYLPDTPREFKRKVRNAQEAHEAIRPAGDSFRHPDEVRGELPPSEARVYEMVWQRTVASQMTDAVGETVQVRMSGVAEVPGGGRDVTFSSSGTVISHQGFRRVYVEQADEGAGDGESEEAEVVLPAVEAGERVTVVEAVPEGHTTQPPARFTEASLVKRLEELGVGRPSTYASIMETIQGRDYVWKKGSALVPTLSAFAVTTLLESHFPRLVDYDFTASMEADLDEIANGTAEKVPWLRGFYYGSDDDIGLLEKVTTRLGDIDGRAVSTVHLGVTDDGEEVVARFGKFGPYTQVGDRTASLPDDLAPDELTVQKALGFLDAPDERLLGPDPETGLPVIARSGRFGPYVSLGRPPERVQPSPEAARLTALPLSRREARVAMAFLQLARAEPDEAAVRRVVNVPSRGIGKGALEKLDGLAEAEGVGFLASLERAGEAGVVGRAVDGIGSFLDLRRSLSAMAGSGPAAVMREALDSTGYLAELAAVGAGEAERVRNLEDLLAALEGFDDLEDLFGQLDALTAVDDQPRPRTASLFQTMTLERITLAEALELLSLPRTVGVDPADGVEITVQNGRYGPYLKKGSDSRSLDSEEQLLTITLDECLAVLAQPKRRGRSAARPPLRELGADPESGRTMILKDGNWGPYVTDGEYNASLGRGDSVEELTDERAAELLAQRRTKGPPGRRRSTRKRS